MLRAYLRIPHQIVLLTDESVLAEDVEVDAVLPMVEEPANALPGRGGVRCFRRLRFFDSVYTKQFGTEWVMSLDLDTLILEDITETLDHMMTPFGFAIVRGRVAEGVTTRPYNGSLYMVRVGQHQDIWDRFNWRTSPTECMRSGWIGSDQVWLSLKLPGAPTLGPEHGVYFLGQYLESDYTAPQAKLLSYAGLLKPWSKQSKIDSPELYEEYQRWLD